MYFNIGWSCCYFDYQYKYKIPFRQFLQHSESMFFTRVNRKKIVLARFFPFTYLCVTLDYKMNSQTAWKTKHTYKRFYIHWYHSCLHIIYRIVKVGEFGKSLAACCVWLCLSYLCNRGYHIDLMVSFSLFYFWILW